MTFADQKPLSCRWMEGTMEGRSDQKPQALTAKSSSFPPANTINNRAPHRLTSTASHLTGTNDKLRRSCRRCVTSPAMDNDEDALQIDESSLQRFRSRFSQTAYFKYIYKDKEQVEPPHPLSHRLGHRLADGPVYLQWRRYSAFPSRSSATK